MVKELCNGEKSVFLATFSYGQKSTRIVFIADAIQDVLNTIADTDMVRAMAIELSRGFGVNLNIEEIGSTAYFVE